MPVGSRPALGCRQLSLGEPGVSSALGKEPPAAQVALRNSRFCAGRRNIPDRTPTIVENDMKNQFIDEFQKQQRIRGMSERTVAGYTENLGHFLSFYRGRTPASLAVADIHNYVLHLKEAKGQSHSYINQQIASVKFFCRHVLRKAWNFDAIPYLKVHRNLPVVLNQDEITRVLNGATNLKHKAIIATLYATGMRNNELTWLKPADIKSQDMVIEVTHGKGGRQRLVKLSPQLLELLRRYWREYPGDKSHWVFPGERPTERLQGDTVTAIFRRCRKRARVSAKASAHTMRHCFATHSLEQGTDIRVIQHLMGHAAIGSTVIYLQVAKTMIARTPSPFDTLHLH